MDVTISFPITRRSKPLSPHRSILISFFYSARGTPYFLFVTVGLGLGLGLYSGGTILKNNVGYVDVVE